MKTVTETAEIFSVTRKTVLNWIDKGLIKAVRPMREYRIPESEIERLMEGETIENEKGDM